jgi:MSHA biogenesis protein MshL
MKSNRLAYLGMAISSVLMLGGCASIAKSDDAHMEVKTEILKAVNETPDVGLKVQEQKEPTPIQVAVAELKKENRFNLLVNKAPVGAILQSLVDGTSYSLVTPEDLTGNISINLKNATAFDVLETLKNVYHYDYEVQDKRIIVYPNGVRTKFFVINHLVGKRKGNSELKVSSGSLTDAPINNSNNNNGTNGSGNNGVSNNNYGSSQSQSQANSTKVSTSVDSDFWKEVEQVVSTMITAKEGRSVIVSPETNTLVVKAMPQEINEVEKYLRKIQAVIDKQVIIEAKLVEVQLSSKTQSGINWGSFHVGNNHAVGVANLMNPPGSSLPNTITSSLTNPTTLSTTGANLINSALSNSSLFGLAFQTSNFAAVLNFLETQGSLQVLSSPRIATLNNQKAILKVGTDEFFITNVTTTSTATSAGTTSTPSVTTQPFFSGIALDITPQIDDNGMVTMHVHPSVSQVSTVVKNINLGNLGNLVLPLASSTISETDSVVKIENNNIVAIGGLMKQYSKKEKSQVPGIGDAPIVGNAFKNTDNDLVKYELVILIKPQIITTQADWETSLAEVRKRLADFDTPHKNIIVNNVTQEQEDKAPAKVQASPQTAIKAPVQVAVKKTVQTQPVRSKK